MRDTGRRAVDQPSNSRDPTQFVFHALGGQVRFVPDAKGAASQMILTVVEGDFPAQRKP